MKKKIAVLGSTGSIGSTLLEIIDQKKFEISFILANRNYKRLLNQAKKFKIRNIIITDDKAYLKAKKINKDKKLKIHNKDYDFEKIINTKLDYVMSSITGIAGLKPTYDIVKFTKKIAIANKESLICAWPLLNKELKKNKTEFIPIDSEHFSIWSEIKNIDPKKIKKIYLTASGGPLFNYDLKFFDKIKLHHVLNHPTWKMGKKISVDSATLMNKCFEVIEAKNIFNLSYKKIGILIHPESYIHAIVSYNNGISKMILHETTMKIPIFNSIYNHTKKLPMKSNLNINFLNNLELNFVDKKKFPLIKILDLLPKKNSLFETAIIFINDFFVNKFLNKKINYNQMIKFIYNSINSNEILKLRYKQVNNLDDIYNLKRHLMFKFNKISI